MKKLMSLLLVVLMAVALLPAAALAAGETVKNLEVTDASYYSSGALKSISAKFDWDQGAVTARLTLMTQRLQGTGDYGDWGDFSNFGNYATAYDDFNEVLADNSKFGIIAHTDEMSIGLNSVNNSVCFNFAENAIPLSTNATYYVYLWSQYYGHCYPDNLMFVIQVRDGAVQYTPATPESGRNVYDASAFEAVVSKTTFYVAITAAEHMTKTETSGAATQTDLGVPMTAVVYTADRGYVFPEGYGSGLGGNGITVTRNSDKQITISGMPTGNTDIVLGAPQADTLYEIGLAANITGGVLSSDCSQAYAGETVTLSATPETGYNFVAFRVQDASGAAVTVTDGKFTMPASNVSVAAEFAKKEYSVTYMADGRQVGEIQTVKHGENAVPETVPAKEGYTGSWDHNGKNIIADTTITANYVINTYEVKYMANGQQVGQTQTVKHGENAVPETVPAKEGYTGSWSSDGTNITADTTITANYVINTYEVKYMANGQQVGQTQTVKHGENAVPETIPAKEGYMAQWSANGKNITADTTIEAVYTAIPAEPPVAEIPATGDERSVLLWGGMLLLAMGAAALVIGKKRYN